MSLLSTIIPGSIPGGDLNKVRPGTRNSFGAYSYYFKGGSNFFEGYSMVFMPGIF